MDVEESRQWSFVVVDDEDEGGGHPYAGSHFDKANTVIEIRCLVPNYIRCCCCVGVRGGCDAESKCDDGVT